MLDHQGNQIDTTFGDGKVAFPTHLVSVTQISVDTKGEYLATCSSDGTVCPIAIRVLVGMTTNAAHFSFQINVFGLYSNDFNHKLTSDQPVNAIALEPLDTNQTHSSAAASALSVVTAASSAASSSSARRFIAGDWRLQLYEQRTFFKTLRPQLLHEAEGLVSAIAWSGHFVASASGLGVRVYDLDERCSLGMIRWEEPPAADGKLTDYRCNLRWANASTLLIGWVDTIRVCVIRKRNATEVARTNQPGYIVDPVSTFQTDFFVCGLAPLAAGDQIVVLGQLKELDGERHKAQRPIVCVMQYTSCTYLPICTSSITMRGFEEYRPTDYHLEVLPDEHTYFIVAPKDLIVATLCENDDRIQWLINHRKFDEALAAISEHGGRYSQVSVARLYLNHLLDADQFEPAAIVCRRWFGTDRELWEEEVYKFVNRKQLRCIKAYLPRSAEFRLSPHIYEMVLYEYLKTDTAGFKELILEWSSTSEHMPTLYNPTVVINAIIEHIAQVVSRTEDGGGGGGNRATVDAETRMLFEALAFLYTNEGRYEAALATYLRLQHREVFNLIRKHNLYGHIESKIVALMELDRKAAVALLLEKDKIDADVVVRQLEAHEQYLYWVSEIMR